MSEGDGVIKTAIKILVILSFLAVPCAAEIIIVDQQWPYDFNNIQAAIDYAGNGDYIFVFPGTYTGPGNRDLDFLGKAITVRGVFPDDPCIVAETIIDCNGTEEEPHNGFIFDSNEDTNSVLDGLTIIGAHPNAVSCENSSPKITNCSVKALGLGITGIHCSGQSSPVITGCKITGWRRWGLYGYGIFCGPNSTPTIADCAIGECFYGMVCLKSFPEVTNCTINDTVSGIYCPYNGSPIITGCTMIGGFRTDCCGSTYSGIFCGPGSTPKIADCAISEYRCGISCYESDAIITGCFISDNNAIGDFYNACGGISCRDGNAVIIDSNISGNYGSGIKCSNSITIITGCIITDNTNYYRFGSTNEAGGGIYCEQGSILNIDDCTIAGNTVERDGGGIYCEQAGMLNINDCTITGNTAEIGGGGIYCAESNSIITNCTVTDNLAESMGGGICCLESSPEITNCTITGNSYPNYGGGIYCGEGSCPVINNCAINNNSSQTGGGGICCWNSSPVITNCTVNNNIGGGILCDESDSVTVITGCTVTGNSGYNGGISGGLAGANSEILNCIITDNSATLTGGGIHNCSGPIQNCTISGNSAEDGGGGIYCGKNGNAIIIGCTISENISTDGYGGGICGINYPNHANPVITNCAVNNNIGGGIYSCDGPITNCTITGNSGGGLTECHGPISNCIITDNSANGYGGGLAQCSGSITDCVITNNSAGVCGGGLEGCDGLISNCIISYNSSDKDGGGLSWGLGAVIKNCTITGNSAAEYGGGIGFERGHIINCIIVGNSAGFDGGGIYKFGGTCTNSIMRDNWPGQIKEEDPFSPLTVTYCNIQGGYIGLANIDVDPCFVEPGYWDANGTPADPYDDFWVDGDYHLKSEGWSWDITHGRWTYDDVTSRCIDAGNPGSSLADEPLSIPEDPNNIWGQNLRINMGAFGGTAQASIPPYDWALLSDMTNDGISDFNDLQTLSSLWLNTGESFYADFNRDDIVDFFDFALLAQDWLLQTSWH